MVQKYPTIVIDNIKVETHGKISYLAITGERAMEQIVNGVVSIVSSMNKKQKSLLLSKLLQDPSISEDLEDALLLKVRKSKPTRSFSRFVAEMRRQGKLK